MRVSVCVCVRAGGGRERAYVSVYLSVRMSV